MGAMGGRIRGAAFAGCLALASVLASRVHAQPEDPWLAPDVVIAVWPTSDQAATARIELVARALVEGFLVGQTVVLTRAVSDPESSEVEATVPTASPLSQCVQQGGEEEECQERTATGSPPILRIHDATWPSGADAIFGFRPAAVLSPAVPLEPAFSNGVADTTFVGIATGWPVLDAGHYASAVSLEVGDGPWELEQLATLLLRACRETAIDRDCRSSRPSEPIEARQPSDRAIVLAADPSSPSGASLRVVAPDEGWLLRRPVDGDLAIVTSARRPPLPAAQPPSPVLSLTPALPLTPAPWLGERGAVDAGRSFFVDVRLTEEQERAVDEGLLRLRAEIAGGHRVRVERSSLSGFRVHIGAIERPWHYLVRVWLESPDGAVRSAVGQGEVDIVAVGPSLSLRAGREVCGSMPGPPSAPSGNLSATADGQCLLLPWWALEWEPHHLYVREGDHRSHVTVSVAPDPLYWIFVLAMFVLVGFGVWATGYRPTAKWVAKRVSPDGGFRESAQHQWEVTELKTIRDGPMRVTFVGPFGWARPGPDAVLRAWNVAAASASPSNLPPDSSTTNVPEHGVRRSRLYPGVSAFVDGEKRAQIVDDETARRLRDGTLEEPPEFTFGNGCRGPLIRLGLTLVAPVLVLAPARFIPSLWTMEATLWSTSLLAVVLLLVLTATRWTARM